MDRTLPPRRRVVVTGAAGGVATLLRPSLREDYDVVLLDRRRPDPPPEPAERTAIGDLADRGFLRDAVRGASAIVHLAGNPSPQANWEELRIPNVDLTVAVLDAARQADVPRVVFASSSHASGRYDLAGRWPVEPEWPARPCCLYGASKASAEVIGRTYADAHHLSVLCLRLGWVRSRPDTPRGLAQWLSPGDLGRLVRAALRSEQRYGVYYGVSANARGRWSVASAVHELGFYPQDDAEKYAAEIDFSIEGTDLDLPECQQSGRQLGAP